jgi:phage gpG-like protein
MGSIGAPGGDGIMVLKPLELRVGTNVPYAKYNQDTRPFMQLLPEDEEKIVKAITEHIMGGEK